MDETTKNNFDAFVKKAILTNRDDLAWAINVGFDLACNVRDYAIALDEDFNPDVLDHDPVGHLIMTHVRGEWAKKAADKLERKWARLVQKAARRAAYADASELIAKTTKKGTMSLRFNTAMACMGLVAEILGWLGVSSNEPVVLNLLNQLPFIKDDKGRDTSQQVQVPAAEAANFSTCGYELYQLKTLWNNKIPQVWDIMEDCLPKAIDRGSYHRRLRAPLIPGGYLPDVTVRVGQLHVHGKSMEADGSGWYDPEHPTMRPLVAEYGPVALQFTAIVLADGRMVSVPEQLATWLDEVVKAMGYEGMEALSGEFFKGIIYPKQDMNCGHREEHKAPIQFDHMQVKGKTKTAYKKLAAHDPHAPVMLSGIHMGVMKAKTTMGKVSGCFETLENIGVQPGKYEKGVNDVQYRRDRIRVLRLIASLTTDAVDEIGELGPSGLLARATRDDPHLARLGEFIALANGQGAGINPLSVPILQSKLQDSLNRRMWGPANGAGINGKYPMVIIDATLKPGTCVISGYKPGTEIACWRFPTILAQGLLVLKIGRGADHHRIDGKVIQNVIFMHPHDITTCQQGDDDGDEVGISTDPRVIELFGHKIDDGIYHIEPSSEKLDYLATSDEGKEYLRKDPMGPVGKITIWRAALLACGRFDYARAFSVLIQEAIDSQKNLVRMTNPHAAADLNNWFLDRAGEYHIHYKCGGGACLCPEREGEACPYVGEQRTDNWLSDKAGEFDIKVVKEAYDAEIKAAGCIKMVKDGNGGQKIVPGWPLGWRSQAKMAQFDDGTSKEVRVRKQVALNNWKPWREKQDGNFSNLPHVAHDIAMHRWEQWAQAFEPEESIPTKEVLLTVLDRLGAPIKALDISWKDYAVDLRARAGLNEYGKEMKKVRGAATQRDGDADSEIVDEQSRLSRIDNIRAHLELQLSQLSAVELLTIWCMELDDQFWHKGRGGRIYVDSIDQAPEGVKVYRANKPNYAFMAVTSKHSAIMKALGMQSTEACGWFDEETLAKYVRWCRAQPDTFKAMSIIIRKNTRHERECHDGTGEHVHLAECRECTQRLETAIVRSIRHDKTAAEQEETKRLISRMNREMSHESFTDIQTDDDDDGRWYREEFDIDAQTF